MRVKEFDDLGGGLFVWAKCGCMIMASRLTFLDNSTNNEVRAYLKKGAKVDLFKTNAGFRRRLQDGFTKCKKHLEKQLKEEEKREELFLEEQKKKAVKQRLTVAV